MVVDIDEIIVNGQSMNYGQAPVIVNDFTLVPLRAFEAAVNRLDWNEVSRIVRIYP
jgi:hypothetical protein